MTGAELRSRRKALGLTQNDLASQLEVSANTVARWERDEMGMPGMIDLALKSIECKMAQQTDKKRPAKKPAGKKAARNK